MLTAAIVCARHHTIGMPECNEPAIQLNTDLESIGPADIHDALTEHRWVRADGEYYCPRHNPAEAGAAFDPPIPDGAYHPIVDSGWEARAYLGSPRLEVRPIRRPEHPGTGADDTELSDFIRRRLNAAAEAALAASPGPLRTGTHLGRTLYHSAEPGVEKSGVFFGVLDRPEDAEFVAGHDRDTALALINMQVTLLDYAWVLPKHTAHALRMILARPHRNAPGFKPEWSAGE